MLHHDIHEKLLAYTDRELELLRAKEGANKFLI